MLHRVLEESSATAHTEERRNTIRVRSFSGDDWYNISFDHKTCDCPNFDKKAGSCKHLAALGIHRMTPFTPTSHPTFSQALSGLVKSIRIRRVEDAVYWLVYLDNFKGTQYRFRTARRLLVGSTEDGHSVAVMWKRELVRESTKQGSQKVARDMESAHRTALAKGEVGIREKTPAPVLRDFLKNEFLPFAQTKHAAKPLTYRYYKQGTDMLTKSAMVGLRLDEITDQNAQALAAKHSAMSASGINRGLRTLRRALNLAYTWGKIEKPIKITLAKGERQRERVLTRDEETKYLNACPQPWKDCATMILDEGLRPGEVFALRWSHILLNVDGTGLIQIVDGKSKAARRVLPITPRVHALLLVRHEAAGKPEDGWIFPTATNHADHINDSLTKGQHRKALDDSGVIDFVPYTMRHTALTRFGEAADNNIFAVAQIAGHASLTTTKRYVHPQAEAINRVFTASQLLLGTKLGTSKKQAKRRKAAKHSG